MARRCGLHNIVNIAARFAHAGRRSHRARLCSTGHTNGLTTWDKTAGIMAEFLSTPFGIFVLIFAAIVNNMLLGLFAIYAEQLQRKSAELQMKLDLTNTAM